VSSSAGGMPYSSAALAVLVVAEAGLGSFCQPLEPRLSGRLCMRRDRRRPYADSSLSTGRLTRHCTLTSDPPQYEDSLQRALATRLSARLPRSRWR
jgi:hypothetical protein